MNEKYQSELLGALHEIASGLYRIGVIDNEEMEEYDRDCLVQTPITTPKAAEPLEKENVSPVS